MKGLGEKKRTPGGNLGISQVAVYSFLLPLNDMSNYYCGCPECEDTGCLRQVTKDKSHNQEQRMRNLAPVINTDKHVQAQVKPNLLS